MGYESSTRITIGYLQPEINSTFDMSIKFPTKYQHKAFRPLSLEKRERFFQQMSIDDGETPDYKTFNLPVKETLSARFEKI